MPGRAEQGSIVLSTMSTDVVVKNSPLLKLVVLFSSSGLGRPTFEYPPRNIEKRCSKPTVPTEPSDINPI